MIHRYQKKGLNFVLDVNSGAVHLLDDISYAVSGLLDENMGDTCPQSIIDALPDYTADEIREAYDELYELKKAGQLFAQDDYIDVSRYIPVNAPVKALCLHVAHDCNLRYQYCFASTGDFGQGRKIMPPEIAKKASTLLSRVPACVTTSRSISSAASRSWRGIPLPRRSIMPAAGGEV